MCSLGPGDNWFERNTKWKVRDGKSVRLWEDKWLNDTLLKDKFLRLYSLSLCKDKSVADVVSWERRNGYKMFSVIGTYSGEDKGLNGKKCWRNNYLTIFQIMNGGWEYKTRGVGVLIHKEGTR